VLGTSYCLATVSVGLLFSLAAVAIKDVSKLEYMLSMPLERNDW
jgi:hypothetical protein